MTDPAELILAACIAVAIIALGAVITLGNERVRQATLQVRQVAHDYALADLALRREQARRSISFVDQAECLQALAQIALDASKTRQNLTGVTVAASPAAAILASAQDGSLCIFTASAEAFLKANPVQSRHVKERYAINGLTSNPFVIEELEAIGRWHGLTVFPRSTEWSLLVVPSEDYSLLPQRGLSRFLHFKRG